MKSSWKKTRKEDDSNIFSVLDESDCFKILIFNVCYSGLMHDRKKTFVLVLLMSSLFSVKKIPHVDYFISYCTSIY